MEKKLLKIFIEPYPFGKRFALSLVDDTDGATIENVSTVYEYLLGQNFLCTKTVWPLKVNSISGKYPQIPQIGDTLEDVDYKNFCKNLDSSGFEIAMHTASAGNSTRDRTIKAYDLFEDIFGKSPDTNIMHSRNIENIYWGKNCIDNKLISKLISFLEPIDFCGHKVESEYYWGDICKQRTKYVRLFETLKPNTLSFDPATPYHDENKPDVNWWFSATYGEGKRLFEILKHVNIENLAYKRGASIIHLYLRQYLYKNKISYQFQKIINYLNRRSDGWYIPVKILLDRLITIRNLEIYNNKNKITIKNSSNSYLEDLSLLIENGTEIFMDNKFINLIKINEYNQINIGNINPGGSISIFSENDIIVKNQKKVKPNYYKLLNGYATRFLWQFINGRPGMFYQEDLPWAKDLK